MATGELEQRVAAVRRFNRLYTRTIGVLQERAYRSPFSLAAVRVLYELAHRTKPTATELGRELGLDPGYLSRILRGFERRGGPPRTRPQLDARPRHPPPPAYRPEEFAPPPGPSPHEGGGPLRAPPAPVHGPPPR